MFIFTWQSISNSGKELVMICFGVANFFKEILFLNYSTNDKATSWNNNF